MFEYEIIKQTPKTIIFFKGDMDIDVTEMIEEDISPQLVQYKHVEIDFSQVPFVDSSGIGLLITLINNLQESGTQVLVSNLQEEVMQVFSLLQLPEILGNAVFVDFK